MTSENQPNTKLMLLFIPVAYGSYLFHEFGHWSVGELLGNDMAYSLNYVWPKNGQYLASVHELYVSIGGPAFTILQSAVFLLILEKHKTVYAYPLIFFPMFMRFFSLAFGGFSKQDEARISAILEIGDYTVAIIVLVILFTIVSIGSNKLGISFKNNIYFFTVSTLCQLMVIATYQIFSV